MGAVFERILLAVDHSGHSLEAARVTAFLAAAFESRVDVLHVLEAPLAAALTTGARTEVETEVGARALVAGQVARLRERGIETAGAVDESGRPIADAVVAAGRSLDAGLLALGAAGPSALNPLAIGSVAHAVVSRADRPVLVVRESHRLEPNRLLPAVTVAVDGSATSLRAAALATELAFRVDADLELVYVREDVDLDFEPEELLLDLTERACAAGTRASYRVLTGDVAEAIDEAASRRAGGLVVLGRSAQGNDGLLGSVPHRLLRGTWLPVLVVAGSTPVPSLRPA